MVAITNTLLVKEDGSTEPLTTKVELDGVTSPTKPRSRKGFRNAVLLSILLAVISAVGVVLLYRKHYGKETEHSIHLVIEGKVFSEKIMLDKNQHSMIAYEQDGSSVITDIETGYSAVMVDIGSGSPKCVIYQNQAIAPKLVTDQVVDDLYTEIEEEEIDVEMSDQRMVARIMQTDDENNLPELIIRGCKGVTMYITKKIGWIPRNKRQAEEQNEDLVQASEMQPSYRQAEDLLPPQLRVLAGESDHGKGCCLHCQKVYYMCRRVCIQQETANYPYFVNRCVGRACTPIMPCSWWYQRSQNHL